MFLFLFHLIQFDLVLHVFLFNTHTLSFSIPRNYLLVLSGACCLKSMGQIYLGQQGDKKQHVFFRWAFNFYRLKLFKNQSFIFFIFVNYILLSEYNIFVLKMQSFEIFFYISCKKKHLIISKGKSQLKLQVCISFSSFFVEIKFHNLDSLE